MALNLGVFGFSCNQNNRSSLVRMSLHLLQPEHEDKTHIKYRMAGKDRGRFGFASIFACVVSKNQKTPKLNPMADDAIT